MIHAISHKNSTEKPLFETYEIYAKMVKYQHY